MKFIELNSLFRNTVILSIILMSIQSCKKDPEVVPTLLKTSTTEINLGEIKTGVSSNFQLTSEGEGLVIYALSSNKDWLVISTPSGVVTDTSTITVSVLLTAEDLQEGYNEAEISVSPTIDGVESEVQLIKVFGEFEKTTIEVDSASVDLGEIKSSQTFNLSLSKSGSESLTYIVTSDANWLNIENSEGELIENKIIPVTVNTENLPEGGAETSITIQGLFNDLVTNEIVVPVKVFYNNSTSVITYGQYIIENDETWSGEIKLTDWVEIREGVTLTILPGTKISIESTASNNRISFGGRGSLVANGTSEEVIEFISAANWSGISISGNIEMSYAYIDKAQFGIFVGSSHSSKAPLIHHVYFKEGTIGISLSSEFDVSLSHLSFEDVRQNVKLVTVNKVNLSEIDFGSSLFSVVDLLFQTKESDVTVSKSNFYDKEFSTFFNADFRDATNTSLKIQNSFNFKTAEGGNSNGNTIEITDIVDSKIEGIGCGFTDRY